MEKENGNRGAAKESAENSRKVFSAKGMAAGKKTSADGEYNDESVIHLEGLEHIRLRPGMYIGSLGDGSSESDGIYILLKEGIDNAIDEAAAGYGDRIDIDIHEIDDKSSGLTNEGKKENINLAFAAQGGARVKIRDYGRGIPLGRLDDCVANVNTGAKYNGKVFKQAIGMNGVGIKATNALSSYFRAASIRDGKMATVEYERGEKKSESNVKAKAGVKNGTYLEFVPDKAIFGKYAFNMEIVKRRLWNYAYLNPGLLIVCNGGEYKSENGLADLVTNELGNAKPLYKPFSYAGKSLSFVITHTASLEKRVHSFVNGQETADGGTHVSSFLDGFCKAVNAFYRKEYGTEDAAGGLFVAMKISIDNPMFTSQTKNRLGNVEVRAPIIKETLAAIDDWLRRNPDVAGELEDKIIKNQRAHQEINSVTDKQLREAAKSITLKIPKLKDCRYHLSDGDRGRNSMIFITEGDSATGSMVGSRDVSYQAIFSLRGKPENMYGRRRAALYDNEELKNLTFALGLQKEVSGLRYDKIVIATDADNDGYHIRNLVLTYFLLYFADVVANGHVYILETPLFRVRNKKETVYCYSEASRDKQMKRLGAQAEVTRFKGLGEINPDEFKQFIFERKKGESEDKGMHLTPVMLYDSPEEMMQAVNSGDGIKTFETGESYGDGSVERILRFYMGKNTPERRLFIEHHLAQEIDA